MLFGSKRRSAPRSDASSICPARASRSLRSRAKSIRCSQSTAIVAPREAMFVVTGSPRSGRKRLSKREVQRHEVLVRVARLGRVLEQLPQVARERQRELALLGEVEYEVHVLQHHRGRERRRVVVAQDGLAL